MLQLPDRVYQGTVIAAPAARRKRFAEGGATSDRNHRPLCAESAVRRNRARLQPRRCEKRLPASIEELGNLCLRYCTGFLLGGDEATGERYYHLASALSPAVKSGRIHSLLTDYWGRLPKRRSSRFWKICAPS